MKTAKNNTHTETAHHAGPNKEDTSIFSSHDSKEAPFFGPGTIQPKLEIGAPDDKYEREADRVADQVMRMSEPGIQKFSDEEEDIQMKHGPAIQMKCEACSNDEELQLKAMVQRKSGGRLTASPEITRSIHSLKGSGQPLPRKIQQEMGVKIGADFSGVRIYTGSNAIQLNNELGARAFTVGDYIFFNRGHYNPNSGEGKRLLAHELVHTKQQMQTTNIHSSNKPFLSTFHPMISASDDSEQSRVFNIYINTRYLGLTRHFDETARNALVAGVQRELNYLFESTNIQAEIEFGNMPENSPPGTLQLYLVNPRISRQNIEHILERHGIERNEELVSNIMEQLSSEHGLNVRYPSAEDNNPGAIMVPIGRSFSELGSIPINIPGSENTVTHEDNKRRMGTAISRMVLHELGHGFGLPHNDESDIMRENLRIVQSYTEDDILRQNFTQDERERLLRNINRWINFIRE